MSESNDIYQTEAPGPGLWKYVVVDGEYRFINADGLGSYQHADAVNYEEKATAAGIIAIFDTFWKNYYSYSTTLEIGAGADDNNNISKILGKEVAQDDIY